MPTFCSQALSEGQGAAGVLGSCGPFKNCEGMTPKKVSRSEAEAATSSLTLQTQKNRGHVEFIDVLVKDCFDLRLEGQF